MKFQMYVNLATNILGTYFTHSFAIFKYYWDICVVYWTSVKKILDILL